MSFAVKLSILKFYNYLKYRYLPHELILNRFVAFEVNYISVYLPFIWNLVRVWAYRSVAQLFLAIIANVWHFILNYRQSWGALTSFFLWAKNDNSIASIFGYWFNKLSLIILEELIMSWHKWLAIKRLGYNVWIRGNEWARIWFFIWPLSQQCFWLSRIFVVVNKILDIWTRFHVLLVSVLYLIDRLLAYLADILVLSNVKIC